MLAANKIHFYGCSRHVIMSYHNTQLITPIEIPLTTRSLRRMLKLKNRKLQMELTATMAPGTSE